MLFDIMLFESSFYPVCLLGFIIELIAIAVFSTKDPKTTTKSASDLEVTEVSPLFKRDTQNESQEIVGKEYLWLSLTRVERDRADQYIAQLVWLMTLINDAFIA